MSNALTCETCPGFVNDKGHRCNGKNNFCNGTWDISALKGMRGETIMVMGKLPRTSTRGVSLIASRFR